MKKRGFTLVELLAVIIILAVIALIATPLVLNVVDSAKKSAWESSAYGIIEAVKMNSLDGMLSGESMEAVYEFPTDEVDVQGEQPKGGQASVNKKGNVAIAIHNEKWCALKEYDDAEITLVDYDGECTLGMEVTTPDEDNLDDPNAYYYSAYEETTDGFLVNVSSLLRYTGTETSLVIPSSVTVTQPVYYEVTDLDGCVAAVKEENTTITDFNAVYQCSYGYMIAEHADSMVNEGYATKHNGYLKYTNIAYSQSGCVSFMVKYNGMTQANATTQCSGETMDEDLLYEIQESPEMLTFYYNLGIITATREVISTKTNIQANIISIASSAFSSCNLTSVTIPESIKNIGQNAFYGNNLTTVTIPSSVTYIGVDAFEKTSSSNKNLTSIINKTGKAFDWTSITGSSTANQTFETGTITHASGNITVTAQ